MTITKDNKIVWGMILGAILFMGLAYLGIVNYQKAYGNSIVNAPVDLIGSKSGTTTTGVAIRPFVASTTYRTIISGDSDGMVLTLLAAKTSSTTGVVNMHLLASNDANCNATTTSAGEVNQTMVDDINWFDATPFIKGSSGLTSLTNSTTTLQWITVNGLGKELVFTDLIASCFRVDVRGASTSLWAQVRTKQR